MTGAAVIDDKYGEIFADMLAQHPVPATVVQAETTLRVGSHVLRAKVETPEPADPKVRRYILQTAAQLETEFGISVVCLIRPTP